MLLPQKNIVRSMTTVPSDQDIFFWMTLKLPSGCTIHSFSLACCGCQLQYCRSATTLWANHRIPEFLSVLVVVIQTLCVFRNPWFLEVSTLGFSPAPETLGRSTWINGSQGHQPYAHRLMVLVCQPWEPGTPLSNESSSCSPYSLLKFSSTRYPARSAWAIA